MAEPIFMLLGVLLLLQGAVLFGLWRVWRMLRPVQISLVPYPHRASGETHCRSGGRCDA